MIKIRQHQNSLEVAWSRECVPGPEGGAWSGGVPGLGGLVFGGVPGGDPPETATAAGGMHHTGMHSC